MKLKRRTKTKIELIKLYNITDYMIKMIKNNSSNPSVSIIIPVFNGSKTLESTLKAVFKSDYPNFEVIVVDDGSTDNSVEIAKKFPCKIIQKKTNTGAADSRNIGAKAARGEILLFTDADCIVKKDTVTKILESFKKGSDIVAGTYAKVPFNKNNLFSSYHSLLCYHNYINSSVALFGTHCAAIKRKLFRKLGGFDSSISGATIEDLKFQYRVQSLKCNYHLNMKAQVLHNSRHSLNSLLKGYYKRSKFATKLILKIKKIMPTRGGYISNYTTTASYLALFIAISGLFLMYFNPFFIWISLLGLVVFFLSRKKFYSLVKNKRQLLKFIPLSFICDLVVILGGFVGISNYLKERIFK